MYYKPKNEFLIQGIIPVFLLFLFLKFWLGINSSLIANLMTVCFVSLGLFTLVFMSFKLKPLSVISIIIITLIFFSQMLSLVSSNYRFEDGILSFQYLGIALVPVFYKLNYKLYKNINYIIILFFVYYIVKAVPPDEIFLVSRNFISVVLLICTGYQIIASYQNDKQPSILLVFLSLIIAIWSIGRSGISLYIVLLACLPFISNIKFVYKIVFILLIVTVSLSLFYYFYDTLFETAISRFTVMGFEDIRETVNQDYVAATFSSPLYVLMGAPLAPIKSMAFVDFNPHNSFIRLHIYYGFFGFITVISAIIFTLFKYFVKKNYLFLITFAVLVFRSAVDSTSFHGPLDPLIFFFVFSSLKKIHFVVN